MNGSNRQIHVSVTREGCSRLVRVEAHPLPGNLYLIDPDQHKPIGEVWEFPPGSKVKCQAIAMGKLKVLVAFASGDEKRS